MTQVRRINTLGGAAALQLITLCTYPQASQQSTGTLQLGIMAFPECLAWVKQLVELFTILSQNHLFMIYN